MISISSKISTILDFTSVQAIVTLLHSGTIAAYFKVIIILTNSRRLKSGSRMELAKLKKKSFNIKKYREIIQCQALGVILPPQTSSYSRQIERIIDFDACLGTHNQAELEKLEAEDFPDNIFQQQAELKGQNKLYHYFTSKINEVLQFAKAYKEYKSEVHVWTEWMRKIFDTAQRKEQQKLLKINRARKSLERAYKQSHQIYMQVMKRKASAELDGLSMGSTENGNRIVFDIQGRQDLQNSNLEPLMSERAKKKISWIKEIIEEKERILEERKQDSLAIQREKVHFLKLLMKNGYHQVDGVQWILRKLAAENEEPKPSDFPSFLDDITKQCLVTQYKIMVDQKISTRLAFPKIRYPSTTKNSASNSFIDFQSISTENNVRNVYKTTKVYIRDWLSKEKWRTHSLKNMPLSPSKSTLKRVWKEKEYQRLKKVYPRERFQQIAQFVFGNKKYQTPLDSKQNSGLTSKNSQRSMNMSLFMSPRKNEI